MRRADTTRKHSPYRWPELRNHAVDRDSPIMGALPFRPDSPFGQSKTLKKQHAIKSRSETAAVTI